MSGITFQPAGLNSSNQHLIENDQIGNLHFSCAPLEGGWSGTVSCEERLGFVAQGRELK